MNDEYIDNLNYNNINFFLREKTDESELKMNENEIQQLLNNFKKNEYEMKTMYDYSFGTCNFGNNESFYNEEYNVKGLIKICNYYDLDKEIKLHKYKKQELIDLIIAFESEPINFEIVEKRNRLWAYIYELIRDPKTKKFIIWN